MRIVLMLMIMSSVAAAEPAKPSTTRIKDAKDMVTDDCAKARKAGRQCVLDMGKEDVTGGVPTAGGTTIGVVKLPTAGSMIHIRRDFIAEIVKSAEDLD